MSASCFGYFARQTRGSRILPALQVQGRHLHDKHAAVRLNKRIAELGLSSRREADGYIRDGLVLVDGVAVTQLGTKVSRSQQVTLREEAIAQKHSKITICLHKPAGFLSMANAECPRQRPAVQLLTSANQQPGQNWNPWGSCKHRWPSKWWGGLAPAGRLDMDSTGLLILTQDGVCAL